MWRWCWGSVIIGVGLGGESVLVGGVGGIVAVAAAAAAGASEVLSVIEVVMCLVRIQQQW